MSASRSWRRWLVLPPLLLGLGVAAVLVARRREPARVSVPERARALRVIAAEPVDVVPRALGYGTVRPQRVWRAVAEVAGRVVEVHDHLRSGALVKEGELLLRIDPADYELAVARLEADIAQIEAQLGELDAREASEQASLRIERASLEVARREQARLEELARRDAAAASDLDQQERRVLAQEQAVQQLVSSLETVPHRRKALHAARAVQRAALAQAELDLSRTRIEAPFDCRLGELRIEPGQYLAPGRTLFEAHGTKAAEIEAQVPLNQLRRLVDPSRATAWPETLDPETLRTLLDVEVVVRYRAGDFEASWPAQLARLREQLDPRTRTIGLVVAVERPYALVVPGRRPPLVQGMYCEVELRAKPRPARIVVPRGALEDGGVWVVDGERRLRRRAVEVDFVQSGFACLRAGLAAGDRVVVSDPTPAIAGMLVEPVPDQELRARLRAEAAGEVPVR